MRMRLGRALASFALVLLSATAVGAQTTALFFDSQPGDYIGGGLKRTWTPAELTFATNSSSTSWIRLSATNFTSSPYLWWYLDFRAPEGATLIPGVYERAERAAFRSPSLAGIDVDGDGRGCNEITGRFVVHEVLFAGTTLTRFAADFEQHCEGGGPALFGAIRYNSTRASLNPFDGAYPVYSLTVQPAINGYVTASGIDCGAGRTDCAETFGVSTTVTFTPTPSPGFIFLGWAGDCIGTSTGTVTVDRPRLCIPIFNTQDGTGTQNPNYSAGAIFLDVPLRNTVSRSKAVYLDSLGEISVNGYPGNVHVSLEMSPSVYWNFYFYPASGQSLAVGDYPITSPSSGVPGPRLETSCATGGRFRIYELSFSQGTVSSFAADFEQPCGTEPGGMLTGAIRYRAARSSLLPFDGAYPLYSLSVDPPVGGRIATAGIDCGAGSTDCDEIYASSTTVTLQALASPGYEFLAWGAACVGHSDTASITVDRTRRCFAYFQPAVGSSAPANPAFANRLLYRYQPGAPALSTTAFQRRAWTGADSTFTLSTYSSEISVSATSENGSYGVTFAAPSGGTLTPGYYDEAYSSPNRLFPTIRGGSSCDAGRFRIYEVSFGASGQLLALAADFELQCSTNGPVYGVLRYNSNRPSVRPFDGAFPDYTLSITPSVKGLVTGPGIDCGAGGHTDCSETYLSPQTVTLTATPAAGKQFLGWRGACDGGTTVTITVSTTRRCAAVFFSPSGTTATEEPALSNGALFVNSDAGDTIGGGRRHVWSADAVVTASAYSRNSISLRVTQPDGRSWSLEFTAPTGSDLTVGLYENATYPTSGSASPGLRVDSPDRSCSPSGRFQVHEIAIVPDQYSGFAVAAFAADFEQRCSGATAALRGAIRFQSSRPNLIPFATTIVPSLSMGIAIGLDSPGGGWIATHGGAPDSFASRSWSRLPWNDYNATGRGVHVAAGDVDGDGLDELVVGVESGGGGWIAVLDDAQQNHALLAWLQVPWPTYNASNGEVWPAVGDIDGDGRAEIVAGLGAGSEGWFALFDDASAGFGLIRWRQLGWPAYNTAVGITHPAIGNIDGTGAAEIVVGLGPGGQGWIAVLNGADSGYTYRGWLRLPWAGYNSANGETFVAAGDLDGDGSAEIVAGLGAGGWGYLHVFDDATNGYASLAWRRTSWSTYNSVTTGGETHPATGDVDGDGRAEIVLGLDSAPGNGGWIEILDDNGTSNVSLGWRNVGWAAFTAAGGGVFPTVGKFR